MTTVQDKPAPSVDKREVRIKQMFGSIAPVYDLLNHLLSLNIDKVWREDHSAGCWADGVILDCCTALETWLYLPASQRKAIVGGISVIPCWCGVARLPTGARRPISR